MGPTSWPDDYTRLCNLIKDCGLVPDLVPPNYCLPLMCPPKAGFAPHFDSRYRWGEAIMGVNLGQAGEMMFLPTKDGDKAELAARTNGQQKTARVPLPRRSIYVMTGPSRYDWKHGIVKQKPTDLPPSWNPRNLRKSLTLRSTKVFSDVCLQRAVQSEQDPTRRRELLARQKAQARFKAQDGRGERLSGDALQSKASFAHQVLQQMELGFLPADLRFCQSKVTFQLPPGVPTAASMPNENRRMGSGDNLRQSTFFLLRPLMMAIFAPLAWWFSIIAGLGPPIMDILFGDLSADLPFAIVVTSVMMAQHMPNVPAMRPSSQSRLLPMALKQPSTNCLPVQTKVLRVLPCLR